MSKELTIEEQKEEARKMSGLPAPFVVANHVVRINWNSTDQFKASDFICTDQNQQPIGLGRSFKGTIVFSTRQLRYRSGQGEPFNQLYSYEYHDEFEPTTVIQYSGEEKERWEHQFENIDAARAKFPQLKSCHNIYIYFEEFDLVKRLQVKGASCKPWWDYERTFNDGSLYWDRKTVFSNVTEKVEKEDGEIIKFFKLAFSQGEANEDTGRYFDMMRKVREEVFGGQFGKQEALPEGEEN